jgi:hypothetical protein
VSAPAEGARAGAGFLLDAAWFALRRPRMRRQTDAVLDEYSAGWDSYRAHLAAAHSLDTWLRIPGVETAPAWRMRDGAVVWTDADPSEAYRAALLQALERGFPQARSVTEFGAGLGRNLLWLKRARPDLIVRGYELCPPGVEIGNAAAAKFGVDVRMAPLDYLRPQREQFVFEPADVGFTMFSFEQIPAGIAAGLATVQSQVRDGSIHVEPVTENYPRTVRGWIGRLDHWKVDYLKGFPAAVAALPVDATFDVLGDSHNPLMYPSVYTLRRRSGLPA